MSRVRWLGVSLVLVILTAGQARADNSITIQAAGPVCGAIQVGGSYMVASGYSLVSVTVEVRPSGCGCGEGGDGTATASMGAYMATVMVPAGTYDVQAVLQVQDGSGTSYYYYSSTTTSVMVP